MDCNHLIQIGNDAKDWVDYLSALLVPTIAFVGVSIAILQWRTNSNRLKHELFDRRYEQYIVVRDFLGSIKASGKSKLEEQYKYTIGISGMRFLFDKEIAEYVHKNVWQAACDFECLVSELEELPVGEERTKHISKKREISDKLSTELDNLEETFAKYLQLQH